MEENKNLIFEKITAIMKEVGAIGKESENKKQGFKYRGIDAVMNALQPALIKNKVIIIPEVLSVERTERMSANGSLMTFSIMKMRYHFVAAEDGSSIEVTMQGEGMDSGYKSINKAMSAAYKYACFQTFCIPTEEMKDADAESLETVQPMQYQQPQVQPYQPQAQQPYGDYTQAQGGYGMPQQAYQPQAQQPYPQPMQYQQPTVQQSSQLGM